MSLYDGDYTLEPGDVDQQGNRYPQEKEYREAEDFYKHDPDFDGSDALRDIEEQAEVDA